MSNYPAQIDNSISLPQAVDNLTPVQGSVFNALRGAILAVESALGVQPNGLYTNVAARLTNIEGIVANNPIIQIAEDLGGTPASPLVVGLQGRPLADTAAFPGQYIAWNGIAWVPTSLSGDLQSNPTDQTVVGIQDVPVASTTPTTGQALIYNGTQWSPATVAASAGGNVLVYQMGGVAAKNVYTSWTALMAARALIKGPATIVIDDSIVTKPFIDAGVWDLTNNTAIVGNNYGTVGSSNSTNLAIVNVGGSDAQLLNPVYFKDIAILGGNNILPCISAGNLSTSLYFDCYNTMFLNSGVSPVIDAAAAIAITLNGTSGFVTGTIMGGVLAATCQLILNDSTIIASTTLVVTGVGVLNISINGITASCISTQPGNTVTTVFESGNFSGNVNPFSGAANGTVLTKSASNQAEWLAPLVPAIYVDAPAPAGFTFNPAVAGTWYTIFTNLSSGTTHVIFPTVTPGFSSPDDGKWIGVKDTNGAVSTNNIVVSTTAAGAFGAPGGLQDPRDPTGATFSTTLTFSASSDNWISAAWMYNAAGDTWFLINVR